MKRILRNVALVVVVATAFVPVSAFAAKEESKTGFSFWKPWTYFWRDKAKDTTKTDEKTEDTKLNVLDNNALDTDEKEQEDIIVVDTNASVSEDTGEVNIDESTSDEDNIYLYDSDEFGRVQKVIADEFIGEYKLSRKGNERKHIRRNKFIKISSFGGGLPVVLSSLKVNDDYTGSFSIGLDIEKKFKIERQGNNTYIQILSDEGERLSYRYKLKTKRIGDRYILIFDNICWEKSGVYAISKQYMKRGSFGELVNGYGVEVPHIGCPTKGEAKINAYFNRVLHKEYKELKYIQDEVRMYFYASTSYDVKYNKNNIMSVFRERKINGGPGMRNRTSTISYKSFAEVFDKKSGNKLDITDILKGSGPDIDRFILDCYRKVSYDKNSVRVTFGFVEDNVEYSDRDILNGVSFYVDDNDLVFVLDVFDGSRLEIGTAIYKVNILENEDLFTHDFLTSYKG